MNDTIVAAIIAAVGGSAFTGMITATVKSVQDYRAGVRATENSARISEGEADERFMKTLLDRIDHANARADKQDSKIALLSARLTEEQAYVSTLAATLVAAGVTVPPRPRPLSLNDEDKEW